MVGKQTWWMWEPKWDERIRRHRIELVSRQGRVCEDDARLVELDVPNGNARFAFIGGGRKEAWATEGAAVIGRHQALRSSEGVALQKLRSAARDLSAFEDEFADALRTMDAI